MGSTIQESLPVSFYLSRPSGCDDQRQGDNGRNTPISVVLDPEAAKIIQSIGKMTVKE